MAGSNARLEVSGAGKTEDGLVQYNEEVNKLGDDLRELYETIRVNVDEDCLLYTSPSPRDRTRSRMPSSA